MLIGKFTGIRFLTGRIERILEQVMITRIIQGDYIALIGQNDGHMPFKVVRGGWNGIKDAEPRGTGRRPTPARQENSDRGPAD